MAGKKSPATEEDNFCVGWASFPADPDQQECKRVRMLNQSRTLLYECSAVKRKNDVETSWLKKVTALSFDLTRFIALWHRQKTQNILK